MKKTIPSVILAIILSLGLLAIAIYLPATNNRLMLDLMERWAPAETTGLPAKDYPAMVEMITDYLRGGNEPFQYVYTMNGTDYLAFHDYEQQHMEDVQGLFWLCRFVAWLGTGAAILYGFALRKNRQWFSPRTMQGTLLTELVAVTLIAVVGVLNFDGVFEFFHRIAFDNQLWMLNPRTDMLIRLMPSGFFATYAAIIGVLWLVELVAVLFISAWAARREKNKEENNA